MAADNSSNPGRKLTKRTPRRTAGRRRNTTKRTPRIRRKTAKRTPRRYGKIPSTADSMLNEVNQRNGQNNDKMEEGNAERQVKHPPVPRPTALDSDVTYSRFFSWRKALGDRPA